MNPSVVLRLSRAERRAAAEAAMQLARASVELRLLAPRRTMDFLGRRHAEAGAAGAAAEAEAMRVGRLVSRVAARLPWRPTCLRQAMGAQRMLEGRGIGSRLVLGVGRDGEQALAHAWMTVGDRVVIGPRGSSASCRLPPSRRPQRRRAAARAARTAAGSDAATDPRRVR